MNDPSLIRDTLSTETTEDTESTEEIQRFTPLVFSAPSALMRVPHTGHTPLALQVRGLWCRLTLFCVPAKYSVRISVGGEIFEGDVERRQVVFNSLNL